MSDMAEADSARIAKLMEGVGRCIYIYQRIEILLKLLLPHLTIPNTDKEHHAPSDWRILIDSKQTLGPLIKQFSDKTYSEDPDSAEKFLTRLIDERNELVHHYFMPSEKAGENLDIEASIVDLRNRMQFATPFLRSLEETTKQFADALEKSVLEDK